MATAVATAPGYATLTARTPGGALLVAPTINRATIRTVPLVAAAGTAVVGTSIVG